MKRALVLLALLCSCPAWATQYSRPDAAVTGSWDYCTGTNWQDLSDDSDSTYCRDDDNSTLTLSLGAVTEPSVDTGHILSHRRRQDSSGSGSCTFTTLLKDHDGNTILTMSECIVGSSFATCSETLTEGAAAGFDSTDYAGGWYVVISVTSSGTRDCYCADTWLEVPDAAAPAGRRIIRVD